MGLYQDLMGGYVGTFYPKKNGKITPVFQDVGGVGFFSTGLRSEFISQFRKAITPVATKGATVAEGAAKTVEGAGKAGLGLAGGAVLGLGGAAAGYFIGSKKSSNTPISQTPRQTTPVHFNYKYTYNPVDIVTNTWNDYSQQNIIDSPNAGISKKDSFVPTTPITQNPVTPIDFSVEPIQDTEAKSSGTDWATIAAIAGVALVAYGMTGRGEKHGRKKQ